MKLSVFSLKRVMFEGDAESVNCKTTSGEVTILNNHEPLISLLTEGTIKIVDSEKKEHYFPALAGFIEVQGDNTVRVIVEE